MTAKVIYQLSGVGDDELGDGSLQQPVATMDRALELWQPGDTIAPEGVLRTTAAASQSWRDGDRRGVGILLAVVSAVVVLCPLVWMQPTAAIPVCIAVIIAWLLLCPDPEPTPRHVDEPELDDVHWSAW